MGTVEPSVAFEHSRLFHWCRQRSRKWVINTWVWSHGIAEEPPPEELPGTKPAQVFDLGASFQGPPLVCVFLN